MNSPSPAGDGAILAGGTPAVSTLSGNSVSASVYEEKCREADTYRRKYTEERRITTIMSNHIKKLGVINEIPCGTKKEMSALMGTDVAALVEEVLVWWRNLIYPVTKCMPNGWDRFEMDLKKHPCARTLGKLRKIAGGKLPDNMPPEWVWYKWMLPSLKRMMHVWRKAAIRKVWRVVKGNGPAVHVIVAIVRPVRLQSNMDAPCRHLPAYSQGKGV